MHRGIKRPMQRARETWSCSRSISAQLACAAYSVPSHSSLLFRRERLLWQILSSSLLAFTSSFTKFRARSDFLTRFRRSGRVGADKAGVEWPLDLSEDEVEPRDDMIQGKSLAPHAVHCVSSIEWS